MEHVTLVLEPAKEGGYSAYVAEVPGAISQGETLEEAQEMVLEAMHQLLAYRREKALNAASKDLVFAQIALS